MAGTNKNKTPRGPRTFLRFFYRSLFSFPQTARRANLTFVPRKLYAIFGGPNGFAGACLRRAFFPSAPQGQRKKTRGKSSWDGFAENGMPFSAKPSLIGKKSLRAPISFLLSSNRPPRESHFCPPKIACNRVPTEWIRGGVPSESLFCRAIYG